MTTFTTTSSSSALKQPHECTSVINQKPCLICVTTWYDANANLVDVTTRKLYIKRAHILWDLLSKHMLCDSIQYLYMASIRISLAIQQIISDIIITSNGKIFRVTGPLCGEFIGHRWIPRDVFFNLRLNKRSSKQWWGGCFETSSRPSWRHCNVNYLVNQ